MTQQMSRALTLGEAAGEASTWLLDCLIPFWADHGRYLSGGFVEQIGLEGPVERPLRCRVACRQIYVFCIAGKLGWTGPWRRIVDEAVSFLLMAYRRQDGLFRATVSPTGGPLSDKADNYDQAFATFALAYAYGATGNVELRSIAIELLEQLWGQRAHPLGGVWENEDKQAPLQSNPHMHLFEATLAWVEHDGEEVFTRKAAEIARLATDRFIDSKTGALHEYFDADWRPLEDPSGHIVEPGHQFEWAWLLERWGTLGGTVDRQVPRRLYRLATKLGIDARRNVAINQIDRHGEILDANARLWPQTERLKAALHFGQEEEAVAAWQALKGYADQDHPGMFFDICRPDGSFVSGPALASSLYHIACAIYELVQYADQREA